MTGGMYGSPESAIQFFREYSNHLKQNGYQQSRMDPSVFYKRDEQGRTVIIAVIHVDDTLIVGTQDEINKFKTIVGKRFGYTDKDGFKKHLGVWYEEHVDKNGNKCIIATMKNIIENIITTFEQHYKKGKLQEFSTPGKPGNTMAKNEETAIDAEKYRKVVGKIMYLVCKLMPEAANAARDLARHFTNPGPEQWKELARFVGYLKKHQDDIKLTMRKPRAMRVGTLTDSNYGSPKSVSGGIQTLGGSITNWLSKSQSMVTRSSTEAEYVAAVLNASELKFMQMFLEEVFYVTTPGIMLEDNMGCIFLVRNKQMGPRTKAIQIRMHWIREAFEKEELTIDYVKSEENESDIMTKNVTEQLQKKFSERLRNGTLRIYEQWNSIVQSVDGLHRDTIGEAVEQSNSNVHESDESSGTNIRQNRNDLDKNMYYYVET